MNAPTRPPRSKKAVLQNKPSSLLSSDENDIIFSLLDMKCSTLATAVVQVFLSKPPSHIQWCKHYCGVACLVKDNPRRSFFIQVFDVEAKAKVWEQELYEEFQYKTPKPFFHTFETDDCQAGLNFADDEEASVFESVIQSKLQLRQERKRTNQICRNPQTFLKKENKGVVAPKSELLLNNKDRRKNTEKKRMKISKEDIGLPENFVHIQHVGWDPNTGFDFTQQDCFDANLKHFFTIAGVSEKELSDADTRKFIFSFLGEHGGINAALQASKKPASPIVHTKSTNSQSKSPAPLPPSTPSGHRNLGAPPPPPSRGPPPPRPPPASIKTAPCVPPSSAPPPPPPPPPPADVQCTTDSRGPLLEQIRRGTTLNAVQVEDTSAKPSSNDSRGALLCQIRRGIELRPVSEKIATETRSSVENSPLEDLAGALARALQERSFALQHTDDSSNAEDSDDDDDDEDWDV